MTAPIIDMAERRARRDGPPATRSSSLGDGIRALAALEPGTRGGFSHNDHRFGKSLAALPEGLWEPETAFLAWQMLRRYRGQLARLGIDFGRIPTPRDPADVPARAKASDRTIEKRDGKFVLQFRYDATVFAAAKQLGATFVTRPVPHHTISAEHVATVKAFAERHGFTFVDGVPRTPKPPPPPRSAKPSAPTVCGALTVEDSMFCIKFRRGAPQDARRAVEAMPGREWHHQIKTYMVPVQGNGLAMVELAKKWGIQLPPGLEDSIRRVIARTERLRAASSAPDAELEIAGLAEGFELKPYQRAGVVYASETRRCFIADEMGLGKTLQAMATIVHNDAFPVICVVPQAVRANWALEWQKFFPGHSVQVLAGNKRKLDVGWMQPLADLVIEAEGGTPPDVTILNYDVIGTVDYDKDNDEITGVHGHLEDLVKLGARSLIVDESHYVKTPKAQRSLAVRALAESIYAARGTKDPYVLCLSGTALENSPAELINQLRILGRMEDFGGKGRFKGRYCQGDKSRKFLPELNDRLRATCYVRRVKADVYDELDAIVRSVVPMECDPKVMVEYRKAEDDVAEFLAKRAEALAIESGLEDGEAAQAYWEKKLRIEAVAHLVVVGQLKALAAKAKLPAAKAWLRNFHASTDEKILVFGEHRNIVDDLQEFLQCDKIQGGQTSEARQAVVERFQTGDKRSLVLSLKAGGTGLTLTAASNAAFIEQGWTSTLHDQAEARFYGRANDLHGGNAYYLLAPGTVDIRIARLIDSKRQVVGAVMDGTDISDAPDAAGSILGNLLVELAHEGLDRRK